MLFLSSFDDLGEQLLVYVVRKTVGDSNLGENILSGGRQLIFKTFPRDFDQTN